MPSVTDVVNLALVSLGASPITILGEPGKASEQAAAIYPIVRDKVLRGHPWNAAKARASLGALATDPAFGWGKQYQLPADCLRVITVNGDDYRTDPLGGWEIEGRKLLTNATSPIDVEYVRREEDPNVWGPELTTAIAAALAAALAPALTASGGSIQAAEERAERLLIDGKITDGLEEELVDTDEDDSWLAARF